MLKVKTYKPSPYSPALFEIAAVVAFGPLLLKISYTEAAIMGAVLGAVSPAVVVPRMVSHIENNYGTDKSIPQLILAGASLDDVFVIVLFSSFTEIEQSGVSNALKLLDIPVSIILGIALGITAGLILSFIFEYAHKHNSSVRQSIKLILILGFSFLLMATETLLEGKVALSGLLAVMSMACVVKIKTRKEVSSDLSSKSGRIWLAAEILLFVLVGAAVDIRYTLDAGGMAVLLIIIALVIRSVGVYLCLIATPLNVKEKLYCIISYIPKATVQAAIGAVPLSLGLPCGNIVLSIAVLSIIITAPIGALLMDISYKKLLSKCPSANEYIREPI